jgi:hypothetical protein
MFPKSGAPIETDAISEPYLAYPSGSPVKELSLQVLFIELSQREIPQSTSLLLSCFKVPGIRAPFEVPQQSPYGERCLSPEPSFRYPPGSPVKEPALHVLLSELPQREMLYYKSPLHSSLIVPDQ